MKELPHPADGDNPVDGDMMLGDLTSDAVVERLNAYVGAIADREYLNPEKAVAEMRQKLMRVGIHFGDVQFTEESGEISVPLVQYGAHLVKVETHHMMSLITKSRVVVH